MARMPQIPEPEISNLPRVGAPDVAPNFGAASEALDTAAKTMGNLGDQFQDLQDQRDSAAAKLQKATNGVLADQAARDYETKVWAAEKQTQQKYFDDPASKVTNPANYPEEMRQQIQGLHKAAVSSTASPDVAGALETRLSAVDERHFFEAHSWMVGRLKQAGLNSIENQTNDALKGVEDTNYPAAYIKRALEGDKAGGTAGLKSLYKDWSGNPQEAAERFTHDAWWRWGLAQSAKSPDAFQKILDDPKSAYNKNITDTEERAKIAKLTKASDAGFDKATLQAKG